MRTHVSPARTQVPGTCVLGRYRLERRLGAGGFGVVWQAHDEQLGRDVAVKRIAVEHEAVAHRAEREARAAARLQHPGIVALFDSGPDGDDAFVLVSELVVGRTLGTLMREGRLSDRDVLGVGIALCDALDHAHARGVVHRDVKPGNVIVPDAAEGDGHAGAIAKLTDFGVASVTGDEPLTVTGDVVGTLVYMAPEQADGRPAGPEADLYSLALVLFEALAGVNPVRGANAAATARRLGQRLPSLARARRDLDADLCRAIDTALLPDPEARGDVLDLRDALAGALGTVDDEPGTIAPARIEHLARERRATPGWVARLLAGASAGAVAAIGAAAYGAPATAAVAVAVGVALLPRLGWLLAVLAAAAWLAGTAPRDAVALLAAAAPVPLLLRGGRTWWSAPAAAPLLAPLGLAPAWAAGAGHGRVAAERAGLALLGAWWVALAAEHDVALAVQDPELLLHAATWTPAAVLLPLLVRGRALPADLAGAAVWAAVLAGSTVWAAEALALRLDASPVVAACLGAAVAVLGAARRAGSVAR